MPRDNHRPPRVLVFSSGNPVATFLTAGLLHGEPDNVGAVFIQGVGEATPAREVPDVLAEVGFDPRAWVPQVVGVPPSSRTPRGPARSPACALRRGNMRTRR